MRGKTRAPAEAGPEGLRVGNHVALLRGRLDGSSGWFSAEVSSEASSLSCSSDEELEGSFVYSSVLADVYRLVFFY